MNPLQQAMDELRIGLKNRQIARRDFSNPPAWMLDHPGEMRAWHSQAETVLILAGWRSGKTCVGPPWMLREIARSGPGHYGVGSRSYTLMRLALLPYYEREFRPYATVYRGIPPRIEFTDEGLWRVFGSAAEPCIVHFCHGDEPESFAGAGWGAFHGDEFGQAAIPLETHEELNARLLERRGRRLYTTIPYVWNWLKTQVYDRWRESADAGSPCEIEVVNFRTEENPIIARDPATMARVRRDRDRMPPWKAAMRYDGLYTRPGGAVFDIFAEATHAVDAPIMTPTSKRYLGVDFGPVNTAAVFVTLEARSGRYVVYRSYGDGFGATYDEAELNRHAERHVAAILRTEPGPLPAWGGAPSEDAWRKRFARAGLHVRQPPVPGDTENARQYRADRIYAMLAEGRLVVARHLKKLIAELTEYSYELDDEGEPLPKIADPHAFHGIDALGAVVSAVEQGGEPEVRSRVVAYNPEADKILVRGRFVRSERYGPKD